MPRCARQESTSSIYHVIARGVSHQIIFEDNDDRAFFMSRASICLEGADGEIYAWCLMDNHVHLLLRIPFSTFSQSMHALLTGYAGYFNRVHGRTGPLFDGRFKSEPVDSDEYLMTAVRYIHRNPKKAGLTDGLSFPWSSYDEYLGSRSGWSRTGFVLGVFGGKAEFLRFHNIDKGDECLDVSDQARKSVSDAKALSIVQEVIGEGSIGAVKTMPRDDRDAAIVVLKEKGLSTRQIQRLTGVSLGVISKAGK